MAYTYQDFEKQAKDSGYYDKFSEADLNLAQQYPDAGMSILSAKQQYADAKTSEAKAAANRRAEDVRSSYGGYTGGTSGSYFNVNPLSPQSFQDQGYNDQYGGMIEARLKAIDGSQYEDKYNYQDRTNNLLTDLENRKPFQYDANLDPAAQAYRQQYLREGQRATQNTMAQAAMMTGGRPSSYAVTAAAQQGNYYAAQLADKYPELYNAAYERYLKEYQQKAETAQLMGQQGAQDFEMYNQGLKNQAQSAELMANQQAQGYDMYNKDRSFGYGQLTDEVANQRQLRSEEIQRQEAALNKALQAYQLGDSRLLEEMGIDTSKDLNRQVQELQIKQQEMTMQTQEWQDQLLKAQAAAQYGDYSLLKAMGFDVSRADFANQLSIAQIIAQTTGDVSELRKLMTGGTVGSSGSTAGSSSAASSGTSSKSGSQRTSNPSPSQEQPQDDDDSDSFVNPYKDSNSLPNQGYPSSLDYAYMNIQPSQWAIERTKQLRENEGRSSMFNP